jgi:uncharacterized membrane protein
MNTHFNTLLTAVAGETAVALTGAVQMPTPDEVQSVGQLIIQAIIALITVWKLVKKPKKNNDKI